jgi:hypothetical protein
MMSSIESSSKIPPAIREELQTHNRFGFPELKEVNPSDNILIQDEPLHPHSPIKALSELYELLEEYGPSWYTEEHHNHALAALRGPELPHRATRAETCTVQI